MSVIIRLQNLPWSANALDIRQYFRGLSIPEGGVHIVGGELGDAFIAFSTDEDARQAFNMNGGKIKEVQIKLLLSSRTEMQKVIEAARNPTPFAQGIMPQPLTLPAQIAASILENKSDDKKEKKRGRSRSRSRERRRSRDRSRDRTRRRRSRSRDRRDRHRRDRSRSRNRSRTHDRSRSRERRDKRKDEEFSSNSTTHTDLSLPANVASLLADNSWDAQLLSAKLGLTIAGQSNMLNRADQKDTSRDSWPQVQAPIGFGRGNSPTQSNPGDFNRNRMMESMFDDNRQNRNGPPRSPYDESVDSSSSYDQDNYRNRRDQLERDRESKLKYPRPNCCIKIRIGRMGYGDVRRFFQGLFIANDGVKLINDQDGRRTGIAYVRFVHPEGKLEALKRNGTIHRGNPVDIAHCDDLEFENAIDSFSPQQNKEENNKGIRNEGRMLNFNDRNDRNDPCVAILNLPPFTKEHDIITMVGDFPLVSVLMTMNKDNQQLAYLLFAKNEDAFRFCYLQKEKHFVNGQKVIVKQILETVFYEVKRQHNTGNGIIEIPDDDADQPVPIKSDIVSDCIVLKGLPPKTSDRDIIDFFSDIGLVPSRIHVPLGKSNKPSFCYCEFADPIQAKQSTEKNGTTLGMNEVLVEMIPRRDMEQQIGLAPSTPEKFALVNAPPRRPPLLGNGGVMQRPPNPPSKQYIPDAFRNPGCVISLENVPFRAGINEILDFFGEFNIPEENVMRRFNDRGHATGDARVAFSNPLEAQRAFSELRHGKIRDRTIFMHLQ